MPLYFLAGTEAFVCDGLFDEKGGAERGARVAGCGLQKNGQFVAEFLAKNPENLQVADFCLIRCRFSSTECPKNCNTLQTLYLKRL